MRSFSERLALRQRLWWERPGLHEVHRYRDALHRLREAGTFRTRRDPDGLWRCCRFWPRTLVNKWNGREFAAKHGCALPELYWCGSDPSRALLESLPERFAVRSVVGTDRRGVLVVDGERELLRDQPAPRHELRALLPRPPRRWPPRPMLIEEFVGSQDHGLPLEYKCHTFGDTVAAIQVIVRLGGARRGAVARPGAGGRQRAYSADWEPWPDPFRVDMPEDAEMRERPRCLDQMLALAAKLGTELGTYMRIDFFGTDRGCLFNEFSSVPGGAHGFTPHCEKLFAALWEERFPTAT